MRQPKIAKDQLIAILIGQHVIVILILALLLPGCSESGGQNRRDSGATTDIATGGDISPDGPVITDGSEVADGPAGDGDPATDSGAPPTLPYTCARTFFVSTAGNDANSGQSLSSAVRTIGHAMSNLPLTAGDCVQVEDGTYEETVSITTGGNAAASTGYVVLRAATPHQAKVVGPAGSYSAINVNASFVIVDGLDVDAAEGHGVDITDVHHVIVMRCLAHDCGGSGISGNRTDHLHIIGNICHHNASTNQYQTSGISIYQARAISDNAPGFHNIVRGNICYANAEHQVPSPTTDGNGIIIDDFRNTQNGSTAGVYPHATLVENNLCFDNGGKGIQIYLSDHVTVRNNTVYHNNHDQKNSGTWRGEINNQETADNEFYNNIAVTDPAINSNNTAIVDASTGSPNNSIWRNNLTFNGVAGQSSVRIEGASQTQIEAAENLLGVDPQFVAPGIDVDTADFHLKPTSPALNAGSSTSMPDTDLEGNVRPAGAGVDIGAYEQ